MTSDSMGWSGGVKTAASDGWREGGGWCNPRGWRGRRPVATLVAFPVRNVDDKEYADAMQVTDVTGAINAIHTINTINTIDAMGGRDA